MQQELQDCPARIVLVVWSWLWSDFRLVGLMSTILLYAITYWNIKLDYFKRILPTVLEETVNFWIVLSLLKIVGTLQSENKCILHYEMAILCAGLSGMLSINVFGHLNRQLVALFGRLWNLKEVSLEDGEDTTHFTFQSRILLHSLSDSCLPMEYYQPVSNSSNSCCHEGMSPTNYKPK